MGNCYTKSKETVSSKINKGATIPEEPPPQPPQPPQQQQAPQAQQQPHHEIETNDRFSPDENGSLKTHLPEQRPPQQPPPQLPDGNVSPKGCPPTRENNQSEKDCERNDERSGERNSVNEAPKEKTQNIAPPNGNAVVESAVVDETTLVKTTTSDVAEVVKTTTTHGAEVVKTTTIHGAEVVKTTTTDVAELVKNTTSHEKVTVRIETVDDETSETVAGAGKDAIKTAQDDSVASEQQQRENLTRFTAEVERRHTVATGYEPDIHLLEVDQVENELVKAVEEEEKDEIPKDVADLKVEIATNAARGNRQLDEIQRRKQRSMSTSSSEYESERSKPKHPTKILNRKQTPAVIKLPKKLLKDKPRQDSAFCEEEEEEEEEVGEERGASCQN